MGKQTNVSCWEKKTRIATHIHHPHLAKDNVGGVEPWAVDGGQEELRAVRVWTGVRHGQNTDTFVLQFKLFIGKLFTVNAFAAGAVSALL